MKPKRQDLAALLFANGAKPAIVSVLKKAVLLTLLALLFAACAPAQTQLPAQDAQIGDAPSIEEAGNLVDSVAKDQNSSGAQEAVGPDCLGAEKSEIGQGIADQYEDISYDHVMVWFCNGAEFEDILLAIQSSENSDASVEEILMMLSDGFTWDEIWQLLDITG